LNSFETPAVNGLANNALGWVWKLDPDPPASVPNPDTAGVLVSEPKLGFALNREDPPGFP